MTEADGITELKRINPNPIPFIPSVPRNPSKSDSVARRSTATG
jgi:hypothetical protein